jgi:hypothetical protein
MTRLATTVLLVIAGGLAIGGTFGLLERETQKTDDNQVLTLSYTSWKLTKGGTFDATIYFHAPHFGIPLAVAGAFTLAGGLLLMFGRGRLADLARPVSLASAGLLVGTVWTMGMVTSADLSATHHEEGFDLAWDPGIGLWLLLAAGVFAVVGGLMTLFLVGPTGRTARVEPATPRFGIPSLAGQAPQGPQPFGQYKPAPLPEGQHPPQGPTQWVQATPGQQPTPGQSTPGQHSTGQHSAVAQPPALGQHDLPTQHVLPGQQPPVTPGPAPQEPPAPEQRPSDHLPPEPPPPGSS